MRRSLLVVAGAGTLLLTGCGGDDKPAPAKSPAAAASASQGVPAASGPVVTGGGQLPYSVQGVAVKLAPTAPSGTQAEPGQTFAVVTVELKPNASDRTTSAFFLDADLALFQNGKRRIDLDDGDNAVPYMSRKGGAPITPGEGRLQPGVAYTTAIGAAVPQGTSLDTLSLCAVDGESDEAIPGQCLPLKGLPQG
ncbi:hypothetical protein ACFVH6_21280 [Spirillospora sp. NPDC127200]